jgi:hypothetical protein
LKIYSLAAGNFRIVRGMKSKTGYGRGECAQDGFKITVELSSVNRKQAEVSVTLPAKWNCSNRRSVTDLNGVESAWENFGDVMTLRFQEKLKNSQIHCDH